MNKGLVAIIVAILAVGGVAAVVLVNNNKNNNTSSNSSSMSGMNGNKGSGDNAAVATNSVSIKDFNFSPASITVKKGTTVTWTNNDSAAHTVTGDNGGPSSSNLQKGDTYQYTFHDVGTFAYHCSIHPSMTAKVTVTE